jgi:hypothetical protein
MEPSFDRLTSTEPHAAYVTPSQKDFRKRAWLSSACGISGTGYVAKVAVFRYPETVTASVVTITKSEPPTNGAEMAFPGYPLIVSTGSINSKVTVCIRRDSPVSCRGDFGQRN